MRPMPKEYKKFDPVKEGDPCYVCRQPFVKYDKIAWVGNYNTKPAHDKCARKVGETKVN